MPPEPTILAFDTSAAHCAAALLMGGRIVASRHEDMKRGQAERLFPMLDEVLGEVGAVWEELDAIGVGIGPGNFTGIRIAVSAARGLAMSLGVPAIGVSGFEVLRQIAAIEDRTSLAALPAPRDQWLVEIIDDGLKDTVRALVDAPAFPGQPGLAAPAVIGPWTKGMEVESSTLVADRRVPDVAAVVAIPDLSVRIAAAIAEIANARFATGSVHTPPAPLYIRPADAAPASDPPPVILP